MGSNYGSVEAEQRLRQIYESNPPAFGEIIFTSACQFACQHCIYPPEYGRFNSALSSEQWIRIIKNIHDELGIRTFIHCGRSLDDTGVKALQWIRYALPDAQVGLIDNGISMIPYLDELSALRPDWLDISIDGMEKDHDLQRNRIGAFKNTLTTIDYLREKEVAPKVNILICLTSLNKDSVIGLIEFMNRRGFKNFFISPVSTFKDYGPPEDLKVSGKNFSDFLRNLSSSLERLDDAWVDVNIFDVEYMSFIKEFYPELWKGFTLQQRHLAWNMQSGDNELYINYHPLSLSGIRDFTVNSNGDVILPQSMRKGQIPAEDIVGNLVSESPLEIVRKLRTREFFSLYFKFLMEEKNLFKGGE